MTTASTTHSTGKPLTGPQTEAQTKLLHHLARQVSSYTLVGRAGPNAELKSNVNRYIASLDKQGASDAIQQLIDAGCRKPRKPRKPARQTKAYPVRCGGVTWGSRWEHNQSCNNPGCPG